MTTNQPDLHDEQFERLLQLTGSRLSIPPMRDIADAALASITAEQATVQAPKWTRLPWSRLRHERLVRQTPASTYTSLGEQPRSRWKDVGILVGGIGAAAILTLLLALVFRGFGGDDRGRDTAQGQAPPTTAAFSDPALAASTLLVQSLDDATLLSNTAVVPVNPATGAPVPGYAPVPGGGVGLAQSVTTTDGKVYFASFESHASVCEPMSGGAACRGSADVLHLVEATTWSYRSASLPGGSWVSGDAFSPDGRRYAVVLSSSTGNTLLLFDTASAALLAERELDFRPSLVSFALDGAALVVFGQQFGDAPGIDPPGPPQLYVLNAETLEPAWSHTFDDMLMGHWCVAECSGPFEVRESVSWTPGVSIAPDGHTLVAVHADRDVVTRVDLSTGEVRELELHVEAAWHDRLAGLLIAEAEAKGETSGVHRETAWEPDGSRLYVLTINANVARQLDDDTAVLQVIDPESGRILQGRPVEAAATMALSPDTGDVLIGERYAATTESGPHWRTVAYDGETLESNAELDQWTVEVLRTLDGRTILMGERASDEGAEPALLDAETYDIIGSWPVPPGQCVVTAHGPSCESS